MNAFEAEQERMRAEIMDWLKNAFQPGSGVVDYVFDVGSGVVESIWLDTLDVWGVDAEGRRRAATPEERRAAHEWLDDNGSGCWPGGIRPTDERERKRLYDKARSSEAISFEEYEKKVGRPLTDSEQTAIWDNKQDDNLSRMGR